MVGQWGGVGGGRGTLTCGGKEDFAAVMVQKVLLIGIERNWSRRALWVEAQLAKRVDVGDGRNDNFAVVVESDEAAVEEMIGGRCQ